MADSQRRFDAPQSAGAPHVSVQATGSSPLPEERKQDATPRPLERYALERQVQQTLQSYPKVTFSSLVVRMTSDDSMCLHGVVEDDSSLPAALRLAAQVAGVNEVINQLVVRNQHDTDNAES